MNKYDHKAVEAKWQRVWDEKECFVAPNDFTKPKFYALVEFPYPSGQGLHVGHPRSYTALDIVARKKRMQGYNVLYPMGWDAFGLPTENFAIKNHIHPAEVTKKNVARFKSQLKALGLSFDWSREINTTDPNYYKWTQWIFLQLFKHGLAYKKEMAVNWCTSCKCVLANEEVVGGVCERCGSEVVRKTKSQWMLAITKYAQRLIDDLDDVDYIERVKTQQKNWIGRSTGAEVDFKTTEGDTLTVYTTRPDTLFGATYMVISPEHPAIETWADKLSNIDAVRAYREEAARKSDFERTELNKDKTGVRLDGVRAVNPVSGKEIPIFVSDYVLMSYGTGANSEIARHDDRDWAFAKKFGCEIIEVVAGGEDVQQAAFTAKDETGILVHSDFLDGKTVKEAIPAMIAWLEEKGIGRKKVNYKLRDWVFSRQRYWGEPIPLVYCEKCGWVPLPEDQLPLTLPEVDSYEPTENGESPLAKMTDWVNTTCPHCGGPAKRETDTMPSGRARPGTSCAIWTRTTIRRCAPRKRSNTGARSTGITAAWSTPRCICCTAASGTSSCMTSAFVPTKEPYAKRTSHGMILGENGEKMSKSRGNVVNPDEIVDTYGADTMRLYEMFIGDFEKAAPWSSTSIKGCRRFVERIWNLYDQVKDGDSYSAENETLLHKTIKKVGEDIENLKDNTAIAALMTLVNQFYDKGVNRAEYETLLKLVNPFAPHVTEELWQMLGHDSVLSLESWPSYDEAKTVEDAVEIGVQVNGKVKSTVKLPMDCEQQAAVEIALADEKVQKAIAGKNIVKTIVVKNKIINLVVK